MRVGAPSQAHRPPILILPNWASMVLGPFAETKDLACRGETRHVINPFKNQTVGLSFIGLPNRVCLDATGVFSDNLVGRLLWNKFELMEYHGV